MKTFTVQEADALLPQIEALLDDLSQVRAQIVAEGAKLESILKHAAGDGGSKAGSEYVLLLQHFNAALTAIQDFGCELKDLEQGLVDFPSYRGKELVYLCWKRGEDRIRFWHALDSGFAARQPL
ncbi:MAG: DUF2203 domain-containing protein [Chloroflexi bacterium]|nr:DUF2203 domain-containing protein [Chloroflexota bacterium]MCL5951993.1 DUF2203 domain-containing protein [Chloroflexota bacterium]